MRLRRGLGPGNVSGGCKCRSALLGELTVLSRSLKGPLRGRRKEEKRKEGRGKERDGRNGRKYPPKYISVYGPDYSLVTYSTCALAPLLHAYNQRKIMTYEISKCGGPIYENS